MNAAHCAPWVLRGLALLLAGACAPAELTELRDATPQALEPRAPAAEAGWTTFTASRDTRKVYVSPDGDDDHDGLSESQPKRTLAAAKRLLRQGFPDWLLLERGGVWRESLGQWKTSGRSPSEPALVGTYGAAKQRPLLETGARGGVWTNGGNGSPATIDNVALVGLHFRAEAYAGGGDCVGAQFLQPGSHVLVEDCAFEGYALDVVFQGYGGRHTDFRLRRCVIVDAFAVHAKGGHSQGLYAYAVDGLSIEENLFDHNGWNEAVPGAGADIYSHDLYIDNDNTGVVVRGNVIAGASSHGLQLRPGGVVADNLFVGNSIALSVGGGNHPEPDGVVADVQGNVIVDGKDIDEKTPRGWGIWLANIRSGRVTGNLIAGNRRGRQPNAIVLDGRHKGDERASIGVHDLTIEKNVVFNWGGSIQVIGDAQQITGIELDDNDVQELEGSQPLIVHEDPSSAQSLRSKRNRLYSKRGLSGMLVRLGDKQSSAPEQSRASYPEPERDLDSYSLTLGGAGTADLLRAMRGQSRTNWRPELTASAINRYLRAGFGLE